MKAECKALADQIRACKDLEGLAILQTRIDRHYNNGTLTVREYARLDVAIMARKAKIEMKKTEEDADHLSGTAWMHWCATMLPLVSDEQPTPPINPTSTMKAVEAKALTNKSLSGPAIKPYLEIVYDKIQKAARAGESSVTNPLRELSITRPTKAQEEGVYQHLALVDGYQVTQYQVTQHPDPEPGDPRSSSYVTVSWSEA